MLRKERNSIFFLLKTPTVFLRFLGANKSPLIGRTINVPPRIGRSFRPISENKKKLKKRKQTQKNTRFHFEGAKHPPLIWRTKKKNGKRFFLRFYAI